MDRKPQQAPAAAEKAEDPGRPDRDARVIIINAIQDHHDGDRYSAGWSDRKLAANLGVPWAWVKDIRESALQFNGGHDGALDDFMAEARPVLDEAKALLAEVARQQTSTKALAERLGRIEALARRIETEIGR